MVARIRQSLAAAALLALLVPAGAGQADVVATVEGKSIEGNVVALTATAVRVKTKAGEQTVPLGEVVAVTFSGRDANDLMARKAQHVLVAEDGSRVGIRDAKVSEEKGRMRVKAAVDFAAAGVDLPCEGVLRLLRPRADETPADVDRRRESLKLVRGDKDVLVTSPAAGQWIAVNGVLGSVDGEKVSYCYEGADDSAASGTIPIIEMALPVNAKPTAEAKGVVETADGSRLAFASVEMAGRTCRVQSPSLGALSVDAAKVTAIRLGGGGRVTALASLAPAEARETGFFDKAYKWRKDRCVSGDGLRMGGKAYDRGLGMHARCELTFDLGGEYKTFAALAGIDDSVPAGAAVLTVLGDGKPLCEKLALDRSAAPAPVRVPVAGVKKLTIVADFADKTFGVGARVDLVEAALTR